MRRFLAFFTLLSLTANAQQNWTEQEFTPSLNCPTIRMWHTIKADNNDWQVSVNLLYGKPHFFNTQCEEVSQLWEIKPFNLFEGNTYTFGLGPRTSIKPKDFTYIVKATIQNHSGKPTQKCEFSISPDLDSGLAINVDNYNGSACEYSLTSDFPSVDLILKSSSH